MIRWNDVAEFAAAVDEALREEAEELRRPADDGSVAIPGVEHGLELAREIIRHVLTEGDRGTKIVVDDES